MRPNHLRELIRTGKPSLGTRVHNSWPTITEIIGHSKQFDYVEFLAEYAPYDLYHLENLGRAIDLFPNFAGLIKIEQESRTHLAVRAMASGIQNLLFTDARTVEDVRECVRAVRPETPEDGGLHGVGQGRDVGVVLEVGAPSVVQSYRDAVVMLMIEKKEAIENLESLLDVPGVDMVQFGPADYSMSRGLAGQRDHPAVVEAREYMIRTAQKKGVLPRAEIGSASEAEYYLNLGVKHFCLGTDVRTLFNWYVGEGKAMREVLGEGKVI
jgi:2-keto-3-deoxy-L-rhamnonate aldolase RhmA